MRWDELRADREGKLPGIAGATGVVRRFEAPEAMGVRFHEVEAKSALNKVKGNFPFGWSVNAFRGCVHACKFCFARSTHTYLDLDAGRDWEREVLVKVNVPELLRAELAKPSWKRELVAFGTNTDPYQWVESKYELMPPMLEALADARTPVSVLTRSPLALRDLELYKRLNEVAEVSVSFSIPTLEEKTWRATEPHTPHPRKRIEAIAALREAGIASGVLIAPLMPGINDDPKLVEEIVDLCEEAGATFISGVALHLRPGVKEVFMEWLRLKRPDLVGDYERLYEGRAYLRPEDKRPVESGLRRAGRWPGGEERFGTPRRAERPRARPAERQSSLF